MVKHYSLTKSTFYRPEDSLDRRIAEIEFYNGLPNFFFHFHFAYELVLVKNSFGRRLVGNTCNFYKDFDLILLPPGLPHTWSAEAETPGLKAQNTVIKFTRKSLGLEMLAKPEFQSINRLLNNCQSGLHFPGNDQSEINQKFANLATNDKCDQVLTIISILNDLSKDQLAIPIVAPDYSFTLAEHDNQQLSSIFDYIYNHSDQNLSLEVISQKANMSIPTFTRFFKKATGFSFVNYMNKWRIERACILLKNSNKSISEISLLVGYNNLSHFNRQFLNHMQQSPRDYRKSATLHNLPV